MAGPVAALDPSCVWQPDQRQAVAQVLRGLPNNATNEVSGVIYKNAAGEYCYSAPVESQSGRDFSMKVRIPKNASIAALYHTHPNDGQAQDVYFSDGDIRTSMGMNIPSYIKILRTDQIREFTPGKTHKLSEKGKYLATGDAVEN